MKTKYLAAYTESNDWPAFINISQKEDNDVVITVRDRGSPQTGASDNFIEITVPWAEFFKFATELYNGVLGDGRQVPPHRTGR